MSDRYKLIISETILLAIPKHMLYRITNITSIIMSAVLFIIIFHAEDILGFMSYFKPFFLAGLSLHHLTF